MKICAWKACLNILPTRSNLEKKGWWWTIFAFWCSSFLELALHVYSACPFAREVFFSSNMNLGQKSTTHSSIWDWFSACSASLSPTLFNLFLILIHSIWRARNTLLWDGKLENPAFLSYLASPHMDAFIKAQPASQSRLLHSTSRWSPHPSGWIKINVVGAYCAATNIRLPSISRQQSPHGRIACCPRKTLLGCATKFLEYSLRK